jgi:hypothetical protein
MKAERAFTDSGALFEALLSCRAKSTVLLSAPLVYGDNGCGWPGCALITDFNFYTVAVDQ